MGNSCKVRWRILSGLREHLLQFLILLVGNERVLGDAGQADDIRPAAVGRDVGNVVEVDDQGRLQ